AGYMHNRGLTPALSQNSEGSELLRTLKLRRMSTALSSHSCRRENLFLQRDSLRILILRDFKNQELPKVSVAASLACGNAAASDLSAAILAAGASLCSRTDGPKRLCSRAVEAPRTCGVCG